MIEKISGDHADLIAAIDAHGGDLARWPDRALAIRVREAALADRRLRACLDAAAALDHGLAVARHALDAEIEASGAIARVGAAVLARRVPKARRARWMAAAAALVLAAGVGGIVDARITVGSPQQSYDVVVLDPLVFGPMDTDTE